MLSGPVEFPDEPLSSAYLLTSHILRVDSQQLNTEEIDDRLCSVWELDTMGICDPGKPVYDDYENNTRFENGRYKSLYRGWIHMIPYQIIAS